MPATLSSNFPKGLRATHGGPTRTAWDAGAVAAPPDWLESLIDRIDRAAGDPTRLDELFTELRSTHGPAEASRRWWAAFGASDASAT